MAKSSVNSSAYSRHASYQTSIPRRLAIGSFHILRRRFIRLTVLSLLFITVLLLGVLGYFFRPAKINSMVDELLATALVDADLLSYDRDKTRVEFPSLGGKGEVHLYNIKLRSNSDQYDVLTLPEVVLHYDLLGLPASPLSKVEIPSGVVAVVNADKDGNFIDAGMLKPSDSEGGGLDLLLPELVINNATVVFRLPSALKEPDAHYAWSAEKSASAQTPDGDESQGVDFLYNGHRGYFLSNLSLRGRVNPEDSSKLVFQGKTNCDVWKDVSFAGSISRDVNDFFLDLQAQRSGLELDQRLSDHLQDPIAKVWEMFWTAPDAGQENRVNVSASLRIEDGETHIGVEGFYQGAVMYRDVPLRASEVSGTVTFDGANIKIKDARARRGNAMIECNGWLNGIGTPTESLNINVNVRGLTVDKQIFDALRGEKGEAGELVYPEWEAFSRRGAISAPKHLDVFTMLYDTFEPSGVINLDLTIRSGGNRPNDELDFDVDMVDVSGRMMGNRRDLSESLVEEREDELKAFRSLDRLDSGYPEAAAGFVHNAPGFPLEIYNAQGRVTGKIRNDAANVFVVRGFNREEAAALKLQYGIEVADSTKGLVARRADNLERMYVEAEIADRPRGSDVDTSRMRIEVRADELTVDEALMNAAPEGLVETLRAFAPKGKIAAKRVSITSQGHDDQGVTIGLTLGLDGLLASYRLPEANKRLPLDKLEAELRYNSRTGLAEIVDAKAQVLGIDVRIASFQVKNQRPESLVTLEAETDEFELDPKLFDYLPAGAAEVRKFFTVDGKSGPVLGLQGRARASLSIRLGSTLNEEQGVPKIEETVFRIALNAERIAFAPFAPYELRKVTGEIVIAIRDDGVEVQLIGIKARTIDDSVEDEEGASVSIEGGVFLPSDQNMPGTWNFSLRGERVLLSKRLQSAIGNIMASDKGDEESGLVELWKSLEPEGQAIGRVTMKGQLSGTFGAEDQTRFAFDIDLKDGALTYDGFALPLVGVEGNLLVTNEGVSFSGFKGRIPNAPNATLEVPLLERRPDGSFVMAISAQNLPLNDEFRAALPESIANIYGVIRPEGFEARIAKERNKAALEASKKGEDLSPTSDIAKSGRSDTVSGEITLIIGEGRFDYSARIELNEVDLEVGVVFERAVGVIEHEASFVGDATKGEEVKQTVKGTMAIDRVEWQKIAFTDVTSSFQMRDDRFIMPNVRGKLYEGNLRASMELLSGKEESSYSGSLKVSRVQLGPLANAVFGKATVDEQTGEQMSGGVDAEMSFSSADERGYIGTGRLDVGRIPLSPEELERLEELPKTERGGRTGSFGRVPLFSGLYEALSLSSGEYFNEAHMYFHLYDKYLEIREMQMLSNGLAVETKGENFILFEPDKRGNQFDLTLIPVLFPRTPAIPGVNIVIDAVRGLVLRIYVTGPMDDPQIQALSKRRFNESEEEEKERVPTPFDEERKRKARPDRVRPEHSEW